MIDLEKIFAKYKDEFLKFDRVQTPKHPRRDISAFILLHELAPPVDTIYDSIISSAEYHQIWFYVDINTVAKNAKEDQILTLIRCGVIFDTENNEFSMYV